MIRLERIKNTKRNVVAGFFNKAVVLVLPFITRTILVRTLGSTYLGLNSLFTSILQVLNLAELGFSSAIIYSMYNPIANDDKEKICALLSFYRNMYRIIGLVILIIGCILLPFLPRLINGETPAGINIYIIYLCYLSNTVLTYFVFAYKSAVLNAFQRLDVISNISTIIQGSMYIVQITVLLIISNYYVYIVCIPLFTIANNIITALLASKMYPEYTCKGAINKETKNAITKQVAGLMVNKVCQVSRNSFDTIFISAYFGLIISGSYANYYYVISAVSAFLWVISNAIVAGVGNSLVTEDIEKNFMDFQKFNFLYMFMSSVCSVCLLCLYEPFMNLWKNWMGGDFDLFPFNTVILFCIYFYILQIGVIRGVYSDAKGLWWQNRYRALIESICNIMLNAVLGYFLGVNGIILATMISLVAINFIWGSQIVFKYYFGMPKVKLFYGDQMIFFLCTLGVAAGEFFAVNRVQANSLVELLVTAIFVGAIAFAAFIIIYSTNRRYRSYIAWFLKRVFAR